MNRRQFVAALAALPLIGRLSPAAAPTPLPDPLTTKQTIFSAMEKNGWLQYSTEGPMDFKAVKWIEYRLESQPGLGDFLNCTFDDNCSISPGDERKVSQ